jgi:hypothetical protein
MRRLAPFATMALLAMAGTATATTAIALNNRALTTTADVIAIASVIESRVVWEGRILITEVTVKVEEVLKGAPGDTIVVSLPGGIDANRRIPIAMTYPGAPSLKKGERTFLFLNRDEDTSRLMVAGFSQGKFAINREPGGEEVVERNLSEIRLVNGAGIVRGSRERVALADFKREISGYVAGQ